MTHQGEPEPVRYLGTQVIVDALLVELEDVLIRYLDRFVRYDHAHATPPADDATHPTGERKAARETHVNLAGGLTWDQYADASQLLAELARVTDGTVTCVSKADAKRTDDLPDTPPAPPGGH